MDPIQYFIKQIQLIFYSIIVHSYHHYVPCKMVKWHKHSCHSTNLSFWCSESILLVISLHATMAEKPAEFPQVCFCLWWSSHHNFLTASLFIIGLKNIYLFLIIVLLFLNFSRHLFKLLWLSSVLATFVSETSVCPEFWQHLSQLLWLSRGLTTFVSDVSPSPSPTSSQHLCSHPKMHFLTVGQVRYISVLSFRHGIFI